MFPQPLSPQERLDALKADLLEAYEFIASQTSQPSLRWIDNMEKQFKSGIKCVKDNIRDANRRTCPKTNERDRRRQPLPGNVIGHLYFDKEDRPRPSEI